MKRVISAACLVVLFSAAWTFFGTAAAQAAPPDCRPRITESAAMPYWSSYNDYRGRVLSVDETIQNLGSCLPCDITVADVATDRGVTLETTLPFSVGDVPPAASASIKLKYRVPPGVARFHSRLKAVCRPAPPQPAAQTALSLDPPYAYANEGCPDGPVPDLGGRTLPADQTFGPRLFTATLRNENGSPAPDRQIKWSLSNPVQFRILESSTVTDENGQAYALVTPPQFFICIVPYFDRGWTLVGARSDDGRLTESLFVYTRCAPLGERPPWAL